MDDLQQYKSLVELEKIVEEIENFLARPRKRGQHPTIYPERNDGSKYRTIHGIRYCDFDFSDDEEWVNAHPQKGLSFSATWDNLKFVHGLTQRMKPKKKPIDIYWILSKADIPSDLKFVADKKNPGHYFLTVTQRMTVHQLVKKLEMLAQRMSTIQDGGIAL